MPDNTGLQVLAGIVPKNQADTFATHFSKYGQGGRHSYTSIAERDSIPIERREYGMEVYVQATGKAYTLINGLTNSDWEETLSIFYIDEQIEKNSVIATYKRGFNNTGAQINQYKFVTLDNGFTFNYPNIKVVNSYDYPIIGLIISNLPDSQSAKFPNYTVLQLPIGIIDTTTVPLRAPVYCNNSGDFTLSWTPLHVGYVLSQSTTPYIYLKLSERKSYKEFTLTAVTLQTIVHNFGYLPNIIVVDNMGRDITSGIDITQDENSIIIQSNVPITGKIIYI